MPDAWPAGRAGWLIYPGSVDVPHSRAYLPDLALAAVVLAEKRDVCWKFDICGMYLTGWTVRVLSPRAPACQHPRSRKP